METPVVFLHGFSREQLGAIMRAVKAVAAETGMDPKEIAFATSTPTNMEWKVRDLIDEVRQEHEYLKNNPPPRMA
ncbi:MAG TPA: DUF3783 domain-containing protein [Termitinemataceae bacterium]|jgi:alkanesulfonate monooxygenase SsuD/methylene tetrahydromethanopterin reductase-like flavin-dependent oxidoreductase (luciferase family)|uniref:DUF3783 domain-containing protein n=1 Tax=Treponema sp. J25 TaxID=2094121 RepID=UPI00104FA0D5|nr:DUF3783 domain-containing protein [Treponema sp. J25]TCW61409.1 DUF3783 domain-containing protein [Treponema sp. J25]HOJ98948.1 DUF3783 domain-containing protein [Termitinemataceae bacterium]HOM23482.1 DUF3783 domain-containing protein [Termitinemataceae bacterium]HPQ00004.1 DUF3783 domain-containing protein [Termitinemataceae bacterium]